MSKKQDALSFVPEYVLCADGKTKIEQRAPNVADYRAFCGMAPELEEYAATQWLNRLLLTEGQDSAEWTAQDRRTALYWLFIHTRDNTIMTQEYQCAHCNQWHTRQIDLVDLSGGITSANRPLKEPLPPELIGEGFIVPLNGHAMMWLEEARNARDEQEPDSEAYEIAHADLRIKELAASMRLNEQPEDLEPVDAFEWNYQRLLTVELNTFTRLAAFIQLTLQDMDHGLESVYVEGEIALVTPAHQCPVKKDEKAALVKQLQADQVPENEWPVTAKEGNTAETRLLLGFHCYNFFPSL
jgi:hypothetical protein